MREIVRPLLVIFLCCFRMLAGFLIISAGFTLLQREGLFMAWNYESSFTGIFIILLGALFVVLALKPGMFD